MIDLAAHASMLQTVLLTVATAMCGLFLQRLFQNSMRGQKPPIYEGFPFVGGLLKFIKGPMSLLKGGYALHGEVFTVPVFTKRVTFLVGPVVSPHFFKATDEEMSQKEVYEFNVPTFGPGVVFDVGQKVRTEQFRFFTEALKKDRLKKYVPQFVMEAEAYIKDWGDEGIVDFKDEFNKLITRTTARTLLGREVRETRMEKVTALLHDLDEGMLPISVVWPYAPAFLVPAHGRRDKAREELATLFGDVVRARRASGARGEDVMQQLIDAKYSANVYGGRATTEAEISGLLIAVLFAGQHTSSITTAWTGLFMNANKASSLVPAEEEQRRLIAAHGAELSFDVLQEMEVLHRCITEALRIHPPLVLLMRQAKAAFAVTTSAGKEYVIPKGDTVAVSPNFAHMLPGVFKSPEAYQPDRFAAPREEDKAAPYSFVGFGGGRHGCLGSNFAYLQIKSVWSVLMRAYEFELLDPVPEADYNSMVVGPKACRVRYTRRKQPLA